MHHIEYLLDQIEEELEGAMGYARKAIKCKEKSPTFSDTLRQMAEQEMHHASILQSYLRTELGAIETEHGQISDLASDLIGYAQDKFVEKEIAIKKLLESKK